MFGGSHGAREFLYTRVTMLVDSMVVLGLGMKVLAWYIDMNGIESNNAH